ncbi:MAG: hypothetical protein KDB18_11930 [Salinibacterium sp.]|nr:hypothetical protein [Salinibacterium sp.]
MNPNGLIRTIEIKDKSGRVVGAKEVVTYQGLLSKAHDEGLQRVATRLVQVPSDDNGRTAIAKALVETTKGKFEGIGDANPENVNSYIIPHLIRMAETRAKARALRDAVNIGVISFEELDGDGFGGNGSDHGPGASSPQATNGRPPAAPPPTGNGDVPMTDAQRRYLFRILAGQGKQGDEAHDFLRDYFGVPALGQVSKEEASRAIDELLSPQSEATHAVRQH